MARDYGESFDLPRLHCIGTGKALSGTVFAVLRPDCGHRISVKIGSHAGRRDGKIVGITRETVKVLELAPDGQGGRLEGPRRLSLEPSDPLRPTSLRCLAYEKSASGVGAWIESEGCPKMRVLVQDPVGDDGESVDTISPTQIRLIKGVVGEYGSCRWIKRTATIERSSWPVKRNACCGEAVFARLPVAPASASSACVVPNGNQSLRFLALARHSGASRNPLSC